MVSAEDRTLTILDDGQCVELDDAGLLRFHRGDARWGAVVAFRALQYAGHQLSGPSLWDRRRLQVCSAHSGPGVRDAIEYVTGCVSRGRYSLTHPERAGQCHKDMAFAWWVHDGHCTVMVRLRDGFVPDEFFVLADRLDRPIEQAGDRERMGQMKTQLIERMWTEPLQALFSLTATASWPVGGCGDA